MNKVTRMIDRAPVACDDSADMAAWLSEWSEAFTDGQYGRFRSIVIVLESDDGQLATITQSIGAMDSTRVVGLLYRACHRKMDGEARIEDLAIG